MYTQLYSRYGFWAIQRVLNRPTRSALHTALQIERSSRSEIAEYQLERLLETLRHAQAHVPLYRDSLGNVDILKVTDRSEFIRRVPFLTKAQIRGRSLDLINTQYKGKLYRVRTGGSTGMPLELFGTSITAANGLAAMIRSRAWWGVDYNDRSVVVIEHGDKFDRSKRGRVHSVLRPLHQRLTNRLMLSAYDLGVRSLTAYLTEIAKFQPSYLAGYSTALYLLSKHRLEACSEAPSTVQALFCTSEMVYPVHRNISERAWGAPVASEYGSVELGVVAHECPAGTHHVMDDLFIVEAVPLGDASRLYELVVTTIGNDSVPLIRYRTGDIVSSKPVDGCRCGRELSTLGQIAGRSHDILRGTDGRIVHGQLVTHVINNAGGVRQFQLTQLSSGEVRLRIVRDRSYNSAKERAISEQLASAFGPRAPVSIEYCDELPPGARGKFRWIVSEMS